MNQIIGILGGMGPEATSYFFDLIIRNTRAEKDQEHIPVIIYNNPLVPPRSDAIQKMAPDPVPSLLNGVRALIRAGADFCVMPCITAHYFLPEVQKEVDIPFVHLLDESAKWAADTLPGLKKAGLISSSGTLKTNLFHEPFSRIGVKILESDEGNQNIIGEAIFGQKGIKAGFTAGDPKKMIISAALELIKRGAEAIIAGCTEIPLVLKPKDIPVPLIEPMEISARVCIQKAGFLVKVPSESEPVSDLNNNIILDTEGNPCSRLTRLARLARLATLNSKENKRQ